MPFNREGSLHMRALVVYESMYGNTARIARAIGDGLASRGVEVEVVAVDDVTEAAAAATDLLVVGGPTHAHGMSSSTTRMTATTDEKNAYDDPTVGPGLRGWIKDLPSSDSRPFVAFDTRFRHSVLLTGSAAKGIARRLEDRGARSVVPAESFFVTKDNTLESGEVERAEVWAAGMAASLGATA
jgi:hypothetical protein